MEYYGVFWSLQPLPSTYVQILPSAPCSETPQIYGLPLEREREVSYPYKATGKIIIL
jgi:hypothetical protein